MTWDFHFHETESLYFPVGFAEPLRVSVAHKQYGLPVVAHRFGRKQARPKKNHHCVEEISTEIKECSILLLLKLDKRDARDYASGAWYGNFSEDTKNCDAIMALATLSSKFAIYYS